MNDALQVEKLIWRISEVSSDMVRRLKLSSRSDLFELKIILENTGNEFLSVAAQINDTEVSSVRGIQSAAALKVINGDRSR